MRRGRDGPGGRHYLCNWAASGTVLGQARFCSDSDGLPRLAGSEQQPVPRYETRESRFHQGLLRRPSPGTGCHRYGLSWQVVPDVMDWLFKDAESPGAQLEAMLKMKKIDLAALKRAHDG